MFQLFDSVLGAVRENDTHAFGLVFILSGILMMRPVAGRGVFFAVAGIGLYLVLFKLYVP